LGGLFAYQANLPAGTIQEGKFSVAANGGVEVGGFEAPINIGSDIQIQTPLAGLNVVPGCTGLTINWTGGDQNSWVTVSLIQSA
jgi:hypothetical protein